MKILIVGSLYGDIDLFNKYAKETNCDVILSVGNIGLYYGNESCKYGTGNFKEYLDNTKEFIKPIIAVPGIKENFGLVQKIWDKEIYIKNFKLLKHGEKYDYFLPANINEGIGITGIGGGFSPIQYNRKETLARYYNYLDMMKVRSNYETNIVLMHQIPGQQFYKNEEIQFHPDMLSFMNENLALYMFFGHYEKWFSASYNKVNRGKGIFCSLPTIHKGYGLLDTKGWNLRGIEILGDIDATDRKN